MVLVPLSYSIYLAFTDRTLFGSGGRFIGFDNFVTLFRSERFWHDLLNTVLYTGGNVGIQVLIGLGVAILLRQKLRGIRVFKTMILCPYMFSAVLTAALFKWILNTNYGIVNYSLINLGILPGRIPLFGTVSTAMATTIMVTVWHYTPFIAIFILARLYMIPPELYEMASIDGASALQRFWYITLPQLKGVIAVVVTLRTIWVFRIFDLIWLLTGGGPVGATETLAIFSYITAFFGAYRLGLACAIGVTIFAGSLILYILHTRIYKMTQ